MIKVFRKVRFNLISTGETRRYFRYAIGEIVLVVIGILIALQINNWNSDRLSRKKEKQYLTNIVIDLKKDIESLNDLSEFRKRRLTGDSRIIGHINGDPVDNLDDFTFNVVNSMMERHFTPNNPTYTELISSGNVNLISNDSIKLLLLELDQHYKTNVLTIEHETFDYREYISKSTVRNIDVERLFPVYLGSKTAQEQKISLEHFRTLMNSKEYKNALFIMTFMSAGHIDAYGVIKAKSEKLIELIQSELKR